MPTLTSPSTEQLKQQVNQLLHSPTFATSETLRKLLTFLAAQVIEARPDSPKVREIAVEVFGRTQDFDSQSDSIVRVHTGRLRSKLAEYYMEDGVDDEVIITIPKGAYALTCHFRHASPARGSDVASLGEIREAVMPPPLQVVDLPTRPAAASKFPVRLFATCLLLVSVVVWGITSYVDRRAEHNKVPAALRTFWQDFAKPSEPSLVVFSNFRLLNGGTTGLQTYNGPDDPSKPIIDTYTTMGEVMGVYDVSRTLLSMGKLPEAKRSRFLTWDDAKDSNLIFVGGPLAETPLRDITLLKEFLFKTGSLKNGLQVGAIYNTKPRPNESLVYFASDSVYLNADVHTSKVDYAVVAFHPSFSASHRSLVLAGISEYGTQGASDFVTSEASVTSLLLRLGVRQGQSIPPFEAVIRVRIEGGVPVKSDLVLVHAVS